MSDENKNGPSWYSFLKKYQGKKETDSSFNREMSSKWKLVGLRGYTSIVGSARAWCGLFVAVGLAAVGLKYQPDGAGAKNWMKYAVGIEWKQNGIPRGAIVQLNHYYKCGSSKGNHVALADGDCTAADLLKSGATINLYGGNQGNTAKVSTYSTKEICAVRWPKDVAFPARVVKSDRCTSGKSGSESTR